MRKVTGQILFAFAFLILAAPAFFVSASTTAGTIDSAYKYAWSSNAGWFNFGLSQGAVTVTDANLTGYVWSENYGWINLSPATGGGVKNDGEGALSGYAWGELAGWINFSGAVINSSGEFTGSATGDIVGTVNFNSSTCANCKVVTDWRPQSVRSGATVPTAPFGGGGGGVIFPNPVPPFSILIDNGLAYTNNPLATLRLSAGADVKRVAISESPNFENASQEEYQPLKTWALSRGDGKKTIYVKFYTQQGMPSNAISASIILDTHQNETGNSPAQSAPTMIQSIIQGIKDGVNSVLPKKSVPAEIISIPKETPEVLRHKWNLLPVSAQASGDIK